jgi:uncharacterized protein YgiM (DUF1202 family)
MKQKFWLIFLLAASVLLLAGKVLVVKVMRSNLLARPDFLSASVAPVQKGAKLELVETEGSWYLVRGANGQKGYIHRSAVSESNVTLSGIVPGKKGASEEELALAAKGFNEGNEKKLRGGKGYNYADLEWVMERSVANAELGAFIRDGRLK